MSGRTPGPWSTSPPSSVVGIGVFARPDPRKNPELVATVVSGKANARAIAAVPELLEACELTQAWRGLPNEGASALWERIAEWFHRETGFLRPGKDSPAAGLVVDGERGRAWNEWCLAKSEEIGRKLAAALAKAGAP